MIFDKKEVFKNQYLELNQFITILINKQQKIIYYNLKTI